MAYRTVLIEDNQVMMERLSSVIKNTPGFVLSARYRNAGDALGQMQAFKPEMSACKVTEKLIEELEEVICLILLYYKKALKNGMSFLE